MIKILVIIILSMNANRTYAQKMTKQQVVDSIETIKYQISQLQKDLNLPTIRTAYDNHNVKYEIKACFWYEGSLVIKIEVSSNTRRTINISSQSDAYINGYWFRSYNTRIVGEDLYNISNDCLLKPNVPQIIYKFYNLEDAKKIEELNKARMVDIISIKEELSKSILDFWGIPLDIE